MTFTTERNIQRWLILISSLIFIGLILFNAALFFQQLKQDERTKMRIWAEAVNKLNEISIDNVQSAQDSDLILSILSSNESIPVITTDSDGNILDTANIDRSIIDNPKRLGALLEVMKAENKPIEISVLDEKQLINYGNSPTLNQLKYYPLGLILFILLLVAVVYFFYKTSKSSEQNKLWAGMAKETAHQIGTPLSSLVGWTEILKSEQVNPEYIEEIEKDIHRLEVITERFSKVGSKPTLETIDIVSTTKTTYDYLEKRSSKLIQFKSEFPSKAIMTSLNAPLYSWTIENLVKNAIDAMKGKGQLTISIIEQGKHVKVFVEDTGKGISKRKFKRVFDPGYTSKKRGWGLGLSFAKRIVEEYHKGHIKVLKSELNKGSTFELKFRKI